MTEKINIYVVLGADTDREATWVQSVWSVAEWAAAEEERLNAREEESLEGVHFWVDLYAYTLNKSEN